MARFETKHPVYNETHFSEVKISDLKWLQSNTGGRKMIFSTATNIKKKKTLHYLGLLDLKSVFDLVPRNDGYR